MNTKTFKIGQLAGLTGLSNDTIRFYERKGLIRASHRSASGYRLFSDADLSRLRFIKRAKHVGFTLDEIGELLELRLHPDAHSCEEVKQFTQKKIHELNKKIDELERIRTSLSTLHTACCGGAESAEYCSILQSLESAGAP
ncbi:MAG: Zn(2+)-responsive transcriptional regulator [Alteromonadaceae bacterium]|nr:Zn(2+)-responsive transcriptional regulator [Alteromonadaceae bacterium]